MNTKEYKKLKRLVAKETRKRRGAPRNLPPQVLHPWVLGTKNGHLLSMASGANRIQFLRLMIIETREGRKDVQANWRQQYESSRVKFGYK